MPGILFFPVPQEQPSAVVDLFSTAVDATSIPASLDPMPYMYMMAAGVGITAVAAFVPKVSDKATTACAVMFLLLPMIVFSPLSSNYGQLFWNQWSTSPQVVSKSDTVTKDEPSLIASTHDDFAAAIEDSDSPFVDGLDSACDTLKENTDNPRQPLYSLRRLQRLRRGNQNLLPQTVYRDHQQLRPEQRRSTR